MNHSLFERFTLPAAMLFSFATTAYGFSTVLEMYGPVTRFALAGLVSLVIQMLIGACWTASGRRFSQGSLAFLLIAVVAVVPTLFSTVFASSANMFLYKWSTVNARSTADAVQPVLEPILSVYDQANKTSSLLDEYSRYASDQADREARSGDSCEGQTLASVCGPICRLRHSQSENASQSAELARTIRQDALTLRTRSGGVNNQDAINNLYRDAVELTTDTRRDELEEYIRRELDGFRDGFILDDGTTRICRDRGAISLLTSISDHLSIDLDIDAAPPRLQEPTIARVAEQNIETIWDTISNLRSRLSVGADPFTVEAREHFLPWVIALLVDVVCAVFAFRLGIRSDPDRGRIWPVVGWVMRGKMTAQVAEEQSRLLDAFRSLRIDSGQNTYLAIPRSYDDGIYNKLRVANLPFVLSKAGLKMRPLLNGTSLDLGKIVPEEAAQLKASTDADRFRVWQVYNADKFEKKMALRLGVL